MTKQIEQKLIIREEVELELVGIIVDFAKKEGLTITNIQEVTDKVTIYMKENATIKQEEIAQNKQSQEVPVQEQSLKLDIKGNLTIK